MIVCFILIESLGFYSCETLSNGIYDMVFSSMCKALLIVCDTVVDDFLTCVIICLVMDLS